MVDRTRIDIGNVKFNQRDVESYSVKIDSKTNKKINTVFLKNGTRLTFADQKSEANARVQRPINKENNVSFFNIMGLEIKGSDKNDEYGLYFCEDYKVDVTGGGADQVRLVDSNHGNIRSDSSDDISTGTLNPDYDTSTEVWIKMNKK